MKGVGNEWDISHLLVYTPPSHTVLTAIFQVNLASWTWLPSDSRSPVILSDLAGQSDRKRFIALLPTPIRPRMKFCIKALTALQCCHSSKGPMWFRDV